MMKVNQQDDKCHFIKKGLDLRDLLSRIRLLKLKMT